MARYYVRKNAAGEFEAWDSVDETVVFASTSFTVTAKKVDELNADSATPPSTVEGNVQSDDAGNNADPPPTAVEIGPQIKVQENILDHYYSYSYSASVYLLGEKQYEQLMRSKKKSVDGYHLLFQSGGAPINVGGVRPPPVNAGYGPGVSEFGEDASPSATGTNPPDAGRNPFFDADFYIDSITLDTSPIGKGSGASHMTASMKFTVVEPMGITLIDRLYAAVANAGQKDSSGKVNYTAADYLMVIRFYGYDENGNIRNISGKWDPEGVSDKSALIEKFIPFKVAAINWSVGSKLVTYEWDCVPQGQLIAGYTARGSIPADVQLVDSTVGGLLSGPAKYSTATTDSANPGKKNTATANGTKKSGSDARAAGDTKTGAPSKADAAPTSKQTITQGLMGALNDFQAELVKRGIYTYPDHYEIEFKGTDTIPASKIRDAKLQLPNANVDKAKTAGGTPATTNAKNLDPAKSAVDMISRSFSITAGQMVTQAIELAIRNSSYISDQALVIINPDGSYEENPNSRNKPMSWFSISMSAIPNSPMDPLRNDYAYNIKYTVAPFRVSNMVSKYFPRTTFAGVHKSYPYWFTGKNTAVLEYQETLNALYSLTVSGSDPKNSAANAIRETATSSMRDIAKYNYAPRSTESSQGADGKSNEAAANAAEVLFSPGDLAECKIKILGDPAWIQQGSLFREVTDDTFTGRAGNTGFNSDGSIAFDSGDVLFEVVWQRPEDYNNQTGVADPFYRANKKYDREPKQSRVYYCTKVISEFRQGRFEQTIHGGLYQYPIPSGANAINPSAAASTNKDNGRSNSSSTGTATGRPSSPDNESTGNGTELRSNTDGDTTAERGAQNGGQVSEPSSANGRYNSGSAGAEITEGQSVGNAGSPGNTTSNGEDVSASDTNAPSRLPPSGQNNAVTNNDESQSPSNQQIAQDY